MPQSTSGGGGARNGTTSRHKNDNYDDDGSGVVQDVQFMEEVKEASSSVVLLERDQQHDGGGEEEELNTPITENDDDGPEATVTAEDTISEDEDEAITSEDEKDEAINEEVEEKDEEKEDEEKDEAITSEDVEEKDDGLKACRVVIENKADYHHEIIESAVLSYPQTTPFLDTKNCSKTKPVIYDFALLNARFGLHAYAVIKGDQRDYINQTEFWSWKTYMEHRLTGSTFERDDGRLAIYGDFIGYDDYTDRGIDMTIDVTCDVEPYINSWIDKNKDSFCISHGECKRCNALTLDRTCFVYTCDLTCNSKHKSIYPIPNSSHKTLFASDEILRPFRGTGMVKSNILRLKKATMKFSLIKIR